MADKSEGILEKTMAKVVEVAAKKILDQLDLKQGFTVDVTITMKPLQEGEKKKDD